MISERAYLWIHLPGSFKPVVCGVAYWDRDRDTWGFRYGKSYLARKEAITLAPPGLPLGVLGDQVVWLDRDFNGALRDASPDAWGRQVMIKARVSSNLPAGELDEIDFLLGAGPDRIGALDALTTAQVYSPKAYKAAPLEQLLQATERLERGEPLDPDLDRALNHGTSVGGARPKALLKDEKGYWIAKFSSREDHVDMVGIEVAAMQLAREAGLSVAETQLVSTLNKRVALIRRFDRVVSATAAGDEAVIRRHMVSAMTLLNLDEYAVRQGHSSYPVLADALRKYARDFARDGRELFRRMVFNILIGNIDDHARNHAFFWDGTALELTPAYDLCPQPRSSYSADQAMTVGTLGRASTLANAISQCERFGLSRDDASAQIKQLRSLVEQRWQSRFTQAGVPPGDIEHLARATMVSASIDDE